MTSLRPEHVGQIFSYAGKAGERIPRIRIGYPLEYLGYSWILRAGGNGGSEIYVGWIFEGHKNSQRTKKRVGVSAAAGLSDLVVGAERCMATFPGCRGEPTSKSGCSPLVLFFSPVVFDDLVEFVVFWMVKELTELSSVYVVSPFGSTSVCRVHLRHLRRCKNPRPLVACAEVVKKTVCCCSCPAFLRLIVVVFVEPCSSTVISKIAALAMTYRHLVFSSKWSSSRSLKHVLILDITLSSIYSVTIYCNIYIYILQYNDNVTYFLRNFCSTWYLCGIFWFKAGFPPFTSCPWNARWWAATWLGPQVDVHGLWSTWSTNWMGTLDHF